jgi:hypothetical protein
MANVDSPNGFTPVRHLSGGTIRMNEYPIATDSATAIFSGDMVELLATGYIDVGDDDSASFLGVFAGCKYTNEAGEIVFSKYWPAAQATLGDSDAVAYVYDDPSIVYRAQCSGTPASTLVGALIDLDNTDSGSTSTGRSAQQLDEDASADDFFRVLSLFEVDGNAWGEFAEVEVLIHKHALAQAAGAAI